MYRKFRRRGFIIINVLSVRSTDRCKEWAESHGLTFPVVADIESPWVCWKYTETGYIPLNLVIGPTLIIYYKATGYNESEIEEKILELLNK